MPESNVSKKSVTLTTSFVVLHTIFGRKEERRKRTRGKFVRKAMAMTPCLQRALLTDGY